MCFEFIWEETTTCVTYSINWLVFITEMKSVQCAVRTGSLNKAVCASSLKWLIKSKTATLCSTEIWLHYRAECYIFWVCNHGAPVRIVKIEEGQLWSKSQPPSYMNGRRQTQRKRTQFCETRKYTKTIYVNNTLELTKDTSFTPDVRKRLHTKHLTF